MRKGATGLKDDINYMYKVHQGERERERESRPASVVYKEVNKSIDSIVRLVASWYRVPNQ